MLKLSKIISMTLVFGLILIYSTVVLAYPALAASCDGGNESGAGGLITNVNAVINSNTQATVSWVTDQNSDSYIKYSNNLLGHTLFLANGANGNVASTMQHTVLLDGLTAGNTYYYEVHSTNASGTVSISCNGGNFWKFTMPAVNVTPPVYTTPGGGGGAAGGSSGQTGSATTPPPPSSLNITLPSDVNNSIGDTAGSVILTIFKYAMGLIGLAALGAVIYGAVLRITSEGNPSKITKGNEWIIGAISGIALLAGSAIIFNTINPNLTQIGKTEKSLSTITAESSTPYNFNLNSLLGSSTAINNAPMSVQYTGLTDQDIKSQMNQDGIGYSKAANFSGMTALQYDRLRAIATNVYSTTDNKIVNVLTTASTTDFFNVNLKKSFDENNSLNVYFKDNLTVVNLNDKVYTLPILPGQGNVRDKGSYWEVSIGK